VFVHESLKRRGITIESPAQADPNTIPELLADERRRRGWTQGYVAAHLHSAVTTVSEWEGVGRRPLVDSVTRWADLLGLRLVVTGERTVMAVDAQATISWWLRARRGDESINSVAARVGVSAKALGRWESGRASFRLVDLQAWAAALDLAVELRSKVES
jgi:transcriptional regulator with XRE-family HTH domain